MAADHPTACPECQAPLPADAPGGFCPTCLLRLAGGRGGRPAGDEAKHAPADLPGMRLPQIFGDYELLEEIARGGMGVVFKARQLSLPRTVALKVILAAPFADAQMRERFQIEAEAMARLKHPNIVTIHEVGLENGLPYFSMEYVLGKNLAQISAPVQPARAAELVRQAAEAIEHAHYHGVLHRDLKPSNLLLAPDGSVRVTDFGLARWLNADSEMTLSGQALGSPSYFPAEQALSPKSATAPTVDVYALGAVLYYLLTGRPPFLASTLAATVQQVLNQEPVAPRVLNPKLPRDLETICLKCLERKPGQRYQTAAALAAELRRFIEGHPIEARPVSPLGKLTRWARRKPAVALVSVLALASLAAGLSGVGWQWQRTRAANAELKRATLGLQVNRAEARFERDEARSGLAQIARVLRDDPAHRVAGPRLISALTWRNWPLPLRELGPTESKIGLICFSPRGRFVATAGLDGSMQIWDEQNQRVTNSWPQGSNNWPYLVLQFSPDERVLLGITSGGRLLAGDIHGAPEFQRGSTNAPISQAEFLPDSVGIVGAGLTGSNNFIAAWSLQSGNVLYKIDLGLGPPPAICPGGRWIAGVEQTNVLRVRDSLTGEPAGKPLKLDTAVAQFAFGPDKTGIIAGVLNDQAFVWNWREGLRQCSVHADGSISALQISSDGSRLALFGSEGLVVFEIAEGAQKFKRSGHHDPVANSGFFPQDRLVVRKERTLIPLDPEGRPTSENLLSPFSFEAAVVSDDGRRLAASPWENACTIWDVEDGRAHGRSLRHAGRAGTFAFSPDGTRLVTGGHDKAARLWNTRTWQETIPALMHTGTVDWVEFSHDGKYLATASSDSTAVIWDAAGHQSLGPLRHGAAVAFAIFNPSDSVLATATAAGMIRFWDARSGQPLTTELDVNKPDPLWWGQARIWGLEFSPDGRRLAVACHTACAQVWDAKTGQRLVRTPHPAPVVAVHFSPDGTRLATICMDGMARVFAPTSTNLLLAAMPLRSKGVSLRFSPDGQKIVAGASEGPIRVWSANSGELLAETDDHQAPVLSVEFSPSGAVFAGTVFNGFARLWDTATGMPLTERISAVPRAPKSLRFSPDGQCLAIAGLDDNIVVMPDCLVQGPVPPWLIELAEAVAGERVDKRGLSESLPASTFLSLRRKLKDLPGDAPYARWVRWFLADRKTRSLYPEL